MIAESLASGQKMDYNERSDLDDESDIEGMAKEDPFNDLVVVQKIMDGTYTRPVNADSPK